MQHGGIAWIKHTCSQVTFYTNTQNSLARRNTIIGQEEVGGKSSLKWYRLAKEEVGQGRYVKEFVSKGEVRLILVVDGISRTLG